MTKSDPSTTADLTITRTFDAPRALVWKAWTEPHEAAQWWGPHGFTTPTFESDLRPGGRLLRVMQAPDGTQYPERATFDDVVTGERLAYHSEVEFQPGSVDLEAHTIVTFEDRGDKTTVTVRQWYLKVSPAAEFGRAGAEQGWNQSLDRLTDLLRTR